MHKIKEKPLPFEGIRVLEYAIFHAGPGAGAILGELGADVIKVEASTGDPLRAWKGVGKYNFLSSSGESIMNDVSNHHKKSITLDITKPKGREIFNKLLKKADVFITNLRKSTKLTLNLDYESLSKINPKLVHANVSGYGKKGIDSDVGAFDLMGQARSGMMYSTGGTEPVPLSLAILDQATAIAISHAIISALLVKERQGIGQEVHVSLYSTAIWLLYTNIYFSSVNEYTGDFAWDRKRNSYLRNLYLCKDGKWVVGVKHPPEKSFEIFCKAIDREFLLDDPRFSNEKKRVINNPALIAAFDEAFTEKNSDEWVELLRDDGLLFATVKKVGDVLTDPQALINDYIVDLDYHKQGSIRVPGYPVTFGKNDTRPASVGPKIGEHTDDILKEMGHSDQEIKDLRINKVI